MGKKQNDEILLMNGIKNDKKERTYSNEPDGQIPEKDKDNEKEKKTKDLESPTGFSTMSPLQKFFFMMSLLLSVLYVVAFGWLIPCKVPDVSDGTEPIIVTEKWKLNFSEIGISTSLKLTNELINGSLLVFGYESIENNELVDGLIYIDGSEGKLLSQIPLHFTPRFISCDNLDMDIDGIKECIIIGDNGYVAVLNQSSETLVWAKQNYAHPAYETASIPAVIPDCDSDGVADLAVAYSKFSSTDGGKFPDSVSMEILSGRTGNTIGVRKPIAECISTISRLQLWKRDMFSYNILFSCNDNDGFGKLWKISTDKLCNSMVDKNISQPNFVHAYRIDEPKYKPFNMLYQPTKKLYSSSENMLVAWKGGNIILLDGESDVSYWSYSSNTSGEIRALFTGQFTNDSDYQVAMITSDQKSGTTLTVLQIETGNKVMRTLYPEYFITEALLLRNMFFGTDGILLKHIKVHSKVTQKHTVTYNNSLNFVNTQPLNKFVIQEEFLISRPGCTDNESLKFVTKDKITRYLPQNSTDQNKIENNRLTAAVRRSSEKDALELFTASTTEESSSSQEININELTTVKLLHLSHALFSKNNTCECRC